MNEMLASSRLCMSQLRRPPPTYWDKFHSLRSRPRKKERYFVAMASRVAASPRHMLLYAFTAWLYMPNRLFLEAALLQTHWLRKKLRHGAYVLPPLSKFCKKVAYTASMAWFILSKGTLGFSTYAIWIQHMLLYQGLMNNITLRRAQFSQGWRSRSTLLAD